MRRANAQAMGVDLPFAIRWIAGVLVFSLLYLLRLLHDFVRRIAKIAEAYQHERRAEHVSGRTPVRYPC
jgi:hypothetical protein